MTWKRSFLGWHFIEHSARTTVAAVSAFLVARLFRLPEAYWACITAIIVTQSSLGATLTISGQRLAGTALGAAAGALISSYFGLNTLAFAVGLFLLGLVCSALHLQKSAYRYAGITLAIVLLVPHSSTAGTVAVHRFLEVSIGIAVALVLTAVWPQRYPVA
ncbi:MAG TPA: FUSC family protein [Terriglobales bacterium]|nr:FUSC family protein [Terriglobales bacterium]